VEVDTVGGRASPRVLGRARQACRGEQLAGLGRLGDHALPERPALLRREERGIGDAAARGPKPFRERRIRQDLGRDGGPVPREIVPAKVKLPLSGGDATAPDDRRRPIACSLDDEPRQSSDGYELRGLLREL